MICSYDNAISVKYVNKKNQRSIWVIRKNIEAEEKWALKKEELEKVQKEYESFVKELKDTLGDDVKDVEVTLDLVDSPVAIKEDKDDPAYMMYMMMKQMGQTPDRPAPKPILQINPNHELIKKLKETSDQNLVADASAAIGDTTITVDDGSLNQVGDILEFGDASAVPSTSGTPSGHFYKITRISTHVLTIARFNPSTGKTETGGLRHAVVDNAVIRRHWEYYFNFSNAPTSTDDVVASSGSLD